MTRPAARPPSVMAKTFSPASEKADGDARQDGVRHRIADQAHAPQHQEHADRAGAERQREDGGERVPDRSLAERLEQELGQHRAKPSPAPRDAGSALSSKASHMRRALCEVVRRQHARASRPRPPARAPAASVCGKFALTRSMSCSAASTVRCSLCQRRTRSQQIGRGALVDGGERLVEHDDARVLDQQAREQHALHLAARQRADGALLEAGQADRGDSVFDDVVILAADAAERALRPPQPHRHHVVDIDRKRAVDVGDLRQIGDRRGRRARRARSCRRAV